jgi:hypothetical protein
MEKEYALLWEVTLYEFLLVTVVLGGGAAWMTGRAIARSWQSGWRLAFYMVLLACAVRFIHFALFHGTLISPWYYAVDLAILLALAFTARRQNRSLLMGRQYQFAFERIAPFGWRRRQP